MAWRIRCTPRLGLLVFAACFFLRRKAFDAGCLGGEAPGAELQALKAENRELKQLLGQQALEIEFLKRVAAYCRQQKSGNSPNTSGEPFPSKEDAD